MRILLLSDINSAHTQKWAIAFAKKGIQIGVFSISKPLSDWYSEHGIVLTSSLVKNKTKLGSCIFSKSSYVLFLPKLKTAIAQFQPQVVHAHYATSYGLLGALSGFHPFIISAWGGDVMHFPHRSSLHKKILKYNFKKADCIMATSEALVNEIKPLSNKIIYKIPFGIDTSYFRPIDVENVFTKGSIVIGTVKSLEEIYGIEILIKAFKKVNDNNRDMQLKLLIVGGGSKEEEYKALVKQLNIADKSMFTGKCNYTEVLNYHNVIDIFVNVSRNESFGVSVLEALACEKPVIVSNIGGLKEVVENGYSGFLVEPQNINATAIAIQKLIENKILREQLGKNGRMLVQTKFNLTNNIKDIIKIYTQLIN